MSKKLNELAKKLQLKIGTKNNTVFGTIDKQVIQVSYINTQAKKGYIILFNLNEEYTSLVDDIALDPKFNELKLKKNLLTLISSKTKSTLMYDHFAIGLTGDKSLDVLPELINLFVNKISNVQEKTILACDECSKTTKEVLLLNNVVSSICESCSENLRMQVEEVNNTHQAKTPNYVLGAMMGLLGSLSGGILWLVIIIFANRDVLMLTILAGIACGFLYKKFAGRLNLFGRGIIFMMTLLGCFIVQAYYTGYLISQGANEGFNLLTDSISVYLSEFILNPEHARNAFSSYLFPLIGAGYAAFFMEQDSVPFEIDKGHIPA